MKKMFMAAAAIIGIIVVQIILAKVFNWRIAEILSSLAMNFLLYYCIFSAISQKRKSAKQEEKCS
ncbi:MAG: hypothetical protein K2P39_11420 [Lachnospiraceae bacterium]|nr:hypothetical protein [Lachnospiraceae bacterium]MDE6983376.1 hypothetical protein [Lachnospiraceae bacterium]